MQRGPALFVYFLAACLVTLSARANPSRTFSSVHVVIAPDTSETRLLAETLRDTFRRLGLSLELELRAALHSDEILKPRSEAPPDEAPLWFDLTDPTQALLYVSDSARERVFVRRLKLSLGLDEVAREELTHMARASVESLLAGGVIGISPAPETDEPPPTLDEDAPRQELRLSLGALYEVRAVAPQISVMHGPGFSASALLPGSTLRLFFSQTAQFSFVETAPGTPLGASFQTLAFRTSMGLAVRTSSSWYFRFGVGAGANVTHTVPQLTAEELGRIRKPFWSADPVLRASLSLGLKAFSTVVWLNVGSDVALTDVRYVSVRDGESTTIFEPRALSPWVGFELSSGLDR